MDQMLTPPEVAKLLKINSDKVLYWINCGKLRAFNVSNGSQPRYRIREKDLEEFLSTTANVPASKRKSRRATSDLLPVKDYFPHIQ